MSEVNLSFIAPLLVMLPLLAAGVTLAAGRHTLVQRIISTAVVAACLAGSVLLLWAADTRGPQVVATGAWVPYEGIVLVVDRLSALMLIVGFTIILGVLWYSNAEGRESFDQEASGKAPLPIFHPSLLVMTAGVATTFVSGDLFHMYVGFEVLLGASFVLLTLGGTVSRVRAGVTYAFVSLLSSTVFLFAVAMVYTATGTVNLAQVSQRMAELPQGTQVMLQALLLVGFAIKAAVFPMSSWLPDSYPTAPAPVTAVFAGLLTKVGVYAMIRTQTLVFPGGILHELMLWAALLTMVVGILGAVAQTEVKRMISFTLVSHIGYMLFGLAIGTPAGIAAAIFYVIHHILIQATLFLVTGMVQRRTGVSTLDRLGGLIRTAPWIALLWFVPAMNLAGIPPFSGFIGKVGLMRAAAQIGTPMLWLLVAGSVVTSLLTLYAIAKTWAKSFWGAPNRAEGMGQQAVPIGPGLFLPTGVLVLVGIGLTVFAGPIYGVSERAAADLVNRSSYVQAVADAADTAGSHYPAPLDPTEQGGH
ncbi:MULTISPECIES: Na+/H+ antiporter subunit D [Kytococcus]|uniref:Na+/H+ antiporter subunit D n=1 Tax=Kytococcus schroeteri TaxID=138300 RepID=A0A2I1PAD0_9MICO|nr:MULTISPECIES: Na+/H+ antiporter subunit D [Kytococcus]OFS13476.1 Na+/H+ antiporter subunit D [Kytococcus sp. HMSC28H12]PKZ41531.1 Na+/H+ antiporter subunit D [Kytococcus schroeteri]